MKFKKILNIIKFIKNLKLLKSNKRKYQKIVAGSKTC